MMRKNNNRNNMKHRNNNNGGRRYQGGGGGNRGNHNDGQNIARQKHHATQQLGKYSDLARNAQINGDRVDVEYYLQHVDHYTRVLTDIAAIEAERHAHFREQNVTVGASTDEHAANTGSAEGGDAVTAAGDAVPADASAPTDAAPAPRQQRSPRPPRRQYQAPQSDNGAAEANSNTTDIPLPGGILPPV